ncbi:hypothetical protein EV363DRAFT_1271913 [Boletus edulis]|uniref:Uncharacterized protein n=1 Tax=Boletus edulis BED1 TaxID=1328754 RepID=A0AAD4BPV9_BOLED|nr:hypothetical protein EV363DRAFT_1271913 [Boletus edulis]KAF8436202.1 hypothetical protein L210DRAFT_950136 [Boletus edulis BED1]
MNTASKSKNTPITEKCVLFLTMSHTMYLLSTALVLSICRSRRQRVGAICIGSGEWGARHKG